MWILSVVVTMDCQNEGVTTDDNASKWVPAVSLDAGTNEIKQRNSREQGICRSEESFLYDVERKLRYRKYDSLSFFVFLAGNST